MRVVGILKEVGRFAQRNSPTIMTALGTAGVITTAVLAVRATPRAMQLIAEEKERQGNPSADTYLERYPSISKWDAVKAAWTCYIPAVAVGVGTIACIIGANSVHIRRTAALASAYSILEKAANAYEEKVVEVIGDKKHREIEEKVARDTVAKNPMPQKDALAMIGDGDVIFYETFSGNYFLSDYESVRKAENDANYELLGDTWLSLNRLYEFIGVEPNKAGDWLGWSPEVKIEFKMHAIMDEGQKKPVVVLNYVTEPRMDPHLRS